MMVMASSCGNHTAIGIPANMTVNNLEEQIFTINRQADTTIVTRQGILIYIPKDAIHSDGNTATIILKEALSLFDMLQAGLTTRSDSRLLSSAGMFYLGIREKASIQGVIKVSVPASYANPSMQLFQGKQQANRINWVDPTTLKVSPSVRKGWAADYFSKNCASCHQVNRESTGPALAGVEGRWKNKHHLYEFIRNNEGLLTSGVSEYAECLFCRYNKTPMNNFPDLTDSSIADLLAYINTEATRAGYLEEKSYASICDSCEQFALNYKLLIAHRDSLVTQNGSTIATQITSPVPNADTNGLPTKVLPPTKNAEYYQLEIKATGWYNIDLLLTAGNDVVSGRLTVELKGSIRAPQNVYLIIPSMKIFAEGGLLEDGKRYGFYDLSGSILLPLARQAYIISLGEKGGKLFMGQWQFKIAADQELTIPVHETSSEQIVQAFAFLRSDSVSVVISPAKHANAVREIDARISDLEKMISRCPCHKWDLAPVTPK